MTDQNTPDTPGDQHKPTPDHQSAPTNDPAPEQPQPAGAEQTPAGGEPDQLEQPDTGGNAEAAKYRRRLRAAETAHQQLAAQLAAVEQQLVGRVMAEERVPDIIWQKLGPDLDEFRDTDTGQLDLIKLGEWAATTRSDLGLPYTVGSNGILPGGGPDPAQGRGPGGRPQPGLADAFRPGPER